MKRYFLGLAMLCLSASVARAETPLCGALEAHNLPLGFKLQLLEEQKVTTDKRGTPIKNAPHCRIFAKENTVVGPRKLVVTMVGATSGTFEMFVSDSDIEMIRCNAPHQTNLRIDTVQKLLSRAAVIDLQTIPGVFCGNSKPVLEDIIAESSVPKLVPLKSYEEEFLNVELKKCPL